MVIATCARDSYVTKWLIFTKLQSCTRCEKDQAGSSATCNIYTLFHTWVRVYLCVTSDIISLHQKLAQIMFHFINTVWFPIHDRLSVTHLHPLQSPSNCLSVSLSVCPGRSPFSHRWWSQHHSPSLSPIIYSSAFHWSHQLFTGQSHCHPPGHLFICCSNSTSQSVTRVTALLVLISPVIAPSHWRAHAYRKWWGKCIKWLHCINCIRSEMSHVARVKATVRMDFFYLTVAAVIYALQKIQENWLTDWSQMITARPEMHTQNSLNDFHISISVLCCHSGGTQICQIKG